jgi:hypothetical protein
MSIATNSVSRVSAVTLAVDVPAGGLGAMSAMWRWLTKDLFDPYRPELHYMRGPGPKWRAKHERGVSR